MIQIKKMWTDLSINPKYSKRKTVHPIKLTFPLPEFSDPTQVSYIPALLFTTYKTEYYLMTSLFTTYV